MERNYETNSKTSYLNCLCKISIYRSIISDSNLFVFSFSCWSKSCRTIFAIDCARFSIYAPPAPCPTTLPRRPVAAVSTVFSSYVYSSSSEALRCFVAFFTCLKSDFEIVLLINSKDASYYFALACYSLANSWNLHSKAFYSSLVANSFYILFYNSFICSLPLLLAIF